MPTTKPPWSALIGFNATGDFGAWTIYTSKRHGAIWFQKSPPKMPFTYKQHHQRDRFRTIATLWRKLPQETRDRWRLAALKARLHISGYALWIFWNQKRERQTIATVERQSGISLLP